MSVSEQSQKGGLEGVVGIAAPTQNPAAHTQYHCPMPPDENLESELVAGLSKALDQFAVGDMGQAVANDASAEMMNKIGQSASHAGPPFHRCSTQIETADGVKRPEKSKDLFAGML